MSARTFVSPLSSSYIRGGPVMQHRTIPASKKPIFLSHQLKSLRGASFGCVNIRSMVRKLDDIMILLNNSDLDYLGLTESWLNSMSVDELSIDGYSLQRCDRGSHRERRRQNLGIYTQTPLF